MTPPNGLPPPIPDWAHDTPRPTPPPSLKRRWPSPHYLDDSDDSLARDGLRALRRAVQDFRLSGMTNSEITRALAVLLRDSWDEPIR